MYKPKALRPGDTVALIAPAGPVESPEEVESAARIVNDLGFRVKVLPGCYARYGYLSGEDEIRARDLNQAFADPEISGIFCLRGGYGCMRILEKVDYEQIRLNPKVFVGYSDITALHIAFNQKCGLVTFHGPMPVSDASELSGNMPGKSPESNYTRSSLLRAISSECRGPALRLCNPGREPLRLLSGGTAQGVITGGNLSLIAASLGTPYEIDTRGKILFLEDIGEPPYRVDRMLTQLRLAGKFKDCSGILLGDWNQCTAEKPENSLTLEQVFKDVLMPVGKPVLSGLKAGHCSEKLTLPLGVPVRMDADQGSLELLESAVS